MISKRKQPERFNRYLLNIINSHLKKEGKKTIKTLEFGSAGVSKGSAIPFGVVELKLDGVAWRLAKEIKMENFKYLASKTRRTKTFWRKYNGNILYVTIANLDKIADQQKNTFVGWLKKITNFS